MATKIKYGKKVMIDGVLRFSPESLKKISESRKGRVISPEWRKKRGGNLNADHIIPFSLLPEEPNYDLYDGYFYRYNLSIGRTLCVDCHKKTRTYGIGTVKLRDTLDKVYPNC